MVELVYFLPIGFGGGGGWGGVWVKSFLVFSQIGSQR